MTKKRILITGANGFVGKNLVANLRKEFDVHCLVRDRTFTEGNTHYFSSYDDASIETAVANCDAIVHAAALLHGSKKAMHSANVIFTKKLVELSKKHGVKFIYISSENVSQGNTDLYSKTKEQAEQEVRKLQNSLIIRPTVIYGPGDEKYVSKLISLIRKLPVVPMLGKGKNKFQFIFIEDLANIIKNGIKQNITGTYVAAGPDSITYDAFVSLLMKELKVKKPVVKVPVALLRPIAHVLDLVFSFPPLTPTQLDNLKKDRNYNIKKSVKIFKYTPTSLEIGIRKLLKTETK